jgi:integrase
MGELLSFPSAVPSIVRCKSRKPNDLLRGRKYLTKSEIEAMIQSLPKWSRTAYRDAIFIRMSWRQSYRLSEALDARWSDIDWDNATI